MVATSRQEGLIEPFEHELLVGALDLEQREIVEVMVPAADVAWASVGASVAELEQAIVDSGHSRLPVIRPAPRREARLRAREGPARRRRRRSGTGPGPPSASTRCSSCDADSTWVTSCAGCRPSAGTSRWC